MCFLHDWYRSSNRSVAFGRCLQVGDWGEKRAKKSNVNFSKQKPIIGSCPKSNKTFPAKRSPILHRVSMTYTRAHENHSRKKRRDANELIHAPRSTFPVACYVPGGQIVEHGVYSLTRSPLTTALSYLKACNQRKPFTVQPIKRP